MEPLRGWGPRKERLKAHVPHGHWKTMTFLAALRHDRIDAPWVIDGPINGKVFSAYVEKILVPTLAQGDIVVLDNLGSHKGKPARAAIRAAGAFWRASARMLSLNRPADAQVSHVRDRVTSSGLDRRGMTAERSG